MSFGIGLPERIQVATPLLWLHGGVDLSASTTLLRQHVVDRILSASSDNPFVLMRGPPGSGKSSILQLVARNRLSHNVPVRVLSIESNFSGYEQLGSRLKEMPKDKGPRYLLCDEIQNLYDIGPDGTSFWGRILKEPAEDGSSYFTDNNVRIIAASTRRLVTNTASPIELDRGELLGFEDIKLTPAEVDDYIGRYLDTQHSHASHLPGLTRASELNGWDGVLNAVVEQCGGHVFAIRHSLEKLNEYAMTHRDAASLCADLISHLLSRTVVANFTRIWAPGCLDVGDSRAELIKAVLDDTVLISVPVQLQLINMFVICDRRSELSPRSWSDVKADILMPLAFRRFFAHLFPHREDLGSASVPTIDELIVSALKQFSMVNLVQAAESGMRVPKETALQHMFFFGLTQSLPPTTEVISEASAVLPRSGPRNSRGELDFYVNTDLHYGIELLRKGDNLAEHRRRFQPGGKYYTPNIESYRLVDFVHEGYKPSSWVDRVVVKFHEDFSGCTVCLSEDNSCVISFQ